jgi:hypothetical protein
MHSGPTLSRALITLHFVNWVNQNSPEWGLTETKTVATIKCGSTKIFKVRRHKMTAVKNHSMALKDGGDTKIEIESLNPTASSSGWICRLALSVKADQSLSVHLTNEEAVKLGTALFQVVAESSRRPKMS